MAGSVGRVEILNKVHDLIKATKITTKKCSMIMRIEVVAVPVSKNIPNL